MTAQTAKTLFGAVEAGGTKWVCGVADTNGTWLARTRIVTRDPEATLRDVLQFFDQQASENSNYAGIGIASFGPLDLDTGSPTHGHLLDTPKAGWSGTDLVSPFRTRFDCPVNIDTDVNAAALAESRLGAGKGCRTVVYITVGTGIGGGVCIEGKTLRGALHPEMGHIHVKRHSGDGKFPGCCPFHGDCLEGMASGPAILARYGVPFEALSDSNEAEELLAYYHGQLAATSILMLAPDRVIFGGGVMENIRLLPAIRHHTQTFLNGYGSGGQYAFIKSCITDPGLGEDSGITGALLLSGLTPGP